MVLKLQLEGFEAVGVSSWPGINKLANLRQERWAA